jgi:hypothetical protein
MHVSLKYLTGALAMWAVRQSPYTAPDNLGVAMEKFAAAWSVPVAEGWPPGYYEFDGHGDLRRAIEKTIDKVPEIQAWNERKNGNQARYNFISRYDGPTDPDNDFIDLGALAGNTAMTCLREYEHDQAFNAKFDREWNSPIARLRRCWIGLRQRFASKVSTS